MYIGIQWELLLLLVMLDIEQIIEGHIMSTSLYLHMSGIVIVIVLLRLSLQQDLIIKEVADIKTPPFIKVKKAYQRIQHAIVFLYLKNKGILNDSFT